jgi:hypothetical protein
MAARRRDHETSSSNCHARDRVAVSVARQSRDKLAANPLELAGMSVELVVAGAPPGQHLAHEDEPSRVQEKIVDLMVENG